MSVPTNLIPTLISGLPEYAGSSTLGYMPYVLEGRTYKVQFSNIAAVGAVPSSRVIAAGTGLAGGGDLSENRVISIAAGGVGFDQLALSGVVAGTYGSGSAIPVLTVDSKGRVTSATTVALDVTGFVPTSRTITAGNGLTGGGSLASNITLAANFSATTPSALGIASAGTSIAVSRGDHVHPAVNLSDTTQTQGALPLGRGGTGDALSPVAGAVVYSTGTKFALTNPGTVGQVLVSNGTDEPEWQTLAGSGTVTSVDLTAGTGISVSGGPITTAGSITVVNTAPDQIVSLTGAGTTTITGAYPNFTITSNDSTVGTVTSVSGTGTVSGLSLSGTVTTAGSLTLGGTLAVLPSNFASQTANTVLAAPNGSAGTPTFRAIVAADIPTLNQNTTGTAANVTGIVAVANGGTGASVAGTARTNLGAAASGANTDITSIALTTGTISATPTNGTDLVNKTYADSIASGINFHQAVRLATAAALPANTYNNGASGVGATLTANANGALSVDGVAAVVGNRILVKNEVAQANNGVYTVTQTGSGAAPYILTRATDFDSSGAGVDQIDAGDFFLVTAGSTQSNTSWVQQTPLPITVGTTALVFTQFAAPVLYSAGTGLTLAGTVFSITNTGVSASTYGSASSVPVLAINAQGQVTSASSSSIAIAASQITSGTVTVAQGGTGATTLTGYVKGSGTSALTASATIPASDISSGAALTKTDDTNVTLTLGGSPTTALLAATSITAGWTGQLAVSRGGTGASTLAANGVLLGNGTSAISATAVGTTGQVLVGNTGGAPTWATLSGIGVTSFSAGTTGFTPSSGTTGAITLAGTLNVANGGTGATALTSGYLVKGNGTSAVSASVVYDDGTNVGIGTSSPGSPLDVNGTIRARASAGAVGVAVIGRSADDGGQIRFLNNAASTVLGTLASYGNDVALLNNTASYSLLLGTNGTERMRIDSSGNVGIGTSSPSAKLQVNGGFAVQGVTFPTSGAGLEINWDGTQSVLQSYNRNTSLYQPLWLDGSFVRFNTSSVERMRIDSSGNVGIGTSAPGYKLDVNAATTGVGFRVYNSGNYATIGGTGSGTISFVGYEATVAYGNIFAGSTIFTTGNTERMRIDASGNVGIGTSSPTGKLDVNGKIVLTGGEDFQLQWTNNSQTWRLNNSTAGQMYLYNVTSTRFPFKVDAATANDTLCLTSTGVGIGTSSPATKLQVTVAPASGGDNGMRVTDGTRIIQTNITGSAYSYIGIGASETMLYSTGNPLNIVSDGQPIKFIAGTAERMRITSNGSVGIGTSAPQGLLHVVAGTNNSLLFRGPVSLATGGSIFAVNAANSAIAPMEFAASAFYFNAGNLLVGTPTLGGTGGFSVDVVGIGGAPVAIWNRTSSTTISVPAVFRNGGSDVGSIYYTNIGTAYSTTSDARLKKNIADADSASSLIDALQVRKFDWKAHGTHQRYGFVAQELVAVAPEAVCQPEDPDTMMSVDHSKLIPMMIKEMQSMRARIAELEGK